jgi:hypothetical protein
LSKWDEVDTVDMPQVPLVALTHIDKGNFTILPLLIRAEGILLWDLR